MTLHSATKTRVLIAAPTPALRAGLRALLAAPALEVVGETPTLAGRGFDNCDVIVVADPDLLADAGQLPGAEQPLSLVVLADDERSLALLRTLPLAGWGLLLRESTAAEIQAAVTAVAQGLIVLPPTLFARLPAARLASEMLADAPAEPLTVREREVLALLSQGLPNKLIARQLQISEHTVKFHVSAIFAKLGATSRTDAVSRGARLGLITL